MKMSKRVVYGFQFMLYLAINHTDENYIKLSEFSREQRISDKFLEAIVMPIKSNGLIDVKRGASGGYRLAKPPDEITLLEIYEAIEGRVRISDTNDSDKNNPNKEVINQFLLDINTGLKKLLDEKNLAFLANSFYSFNNNQMFYI